MRGAARGGGADHLRARLHHLEERVSGGHRPHPRGDGPPLRQRAGRGTSRLQPAVGLDLPQRAHARRRDAVAGGTGPMVAGAGRTPEAAPRALRRADLLHLSLRADGAGARHRSGAQHPGADGARRAGDSPRRSTASCSEAAAVAFNTEVEKNFLKTTFDMRPVAEETVGCGVDLLQDEALQPTRSPRTKRRSQGAAAPPPGARARVPAPASAAGAVPALRRPHRRRQGLRGADRVLHQLQGAGRRRARWR